MMPIAFSLQYPDSCNTFEPLEHLRNNIVFRQYIHNMYSSLRADIELKNEGMKFSLKKEILSALAKPKSEIIATLATYEKYDFKAVQVIFHLIKRNEDFNRMYDALFIQNFIKQLDKKQAQEFEDRLVAIRKAEDITVLLQNDIDFNVPKKFGYITENVLSFESSKFKLKGQSFGKPNKVLSSKREPMKQSAFAVFKTTHHGWGIKAVAKITKGE